MATAKTASPLPGPAGKFTQTGGRSMKHKTRIERFIIVDVLAGACGASGVTAVLQRSWLAAGLAAALGVVLVLLERETIDEEEATENGIMNLTDSALAALEKSASWKKTQKIAPEDLPVYEQGLRAGAADLAQFILEEILSEKESG
jgi:hypothetical protein